MGHFYPLFSHFRRHQGYQCDRRILSSAAGVLWLSCLLGASPAGAQSVLAQATSEPPMAAGESYPESRFGHPPMQVDLGVSSGYASRAVAEIEAKDLDGVSAPNRVPASEGKKSTEQEPSSSAGSSTAQMARKGVQEVALIAGDLGFFPKTVFVTRDVPVRLFVTGASKGALCLMMDSFQIRKQIRSQKIEEITFTPSTPGKYRFYCPVNGMEGTLFVKEFSRGSSE